MLVQQSQCAVFRKEVQLLQSLMHPCVIQLHDVFEEDKYIHLVLDMCTGGELLDRILTVGLFSERQAVAVVGYLPCSWCVSVLLTSPACRVCCRSSKSCVR